MTFPSEVWNGVLRRLHAELPSSTVDAWLSRLTVRADERGLQILCPTQFHLDRLRANFLEAIERCAAAEAGAHLRVVLTVEARDPEARKRAVAAAPTRGRELVPSRPTPNREPAIAATATPAEPKSADAARRARHSFDNFVVGPCNALAREASHALSSRGGTDLRQLYLAAESGLGKTHLSRAAVAAVRQRGARVVYAAAETFTNEFLSAVRAGQMSSFKRRYRRECDVLVVEDVRFFEGKTQTQLEFFHTVQHVLDAGGRVLLTGDRLPRGLSGLDPKLRAQLAAGLVAEMEAPDAQVRRKILREKAAAGGVGLPPECLDLLVEQVRGSVRDLEGVLIQLVTTAALLKKPIDRSLTLEALAKKCGTAPGLERPDPATVIGVVTSFFKTTPAALASRSRRRDVLVPRQLAMYLCRRYTDASMAEIGRALGRDHPAVRNAVDRIERAMLERAPLRYQVEALSQRLDQILDGGRGDSQ